MSERDRKQQEGDEAVRTDLPRQDPTGVDLPPGRAAGEIAKESERATIVGEDAGEGAHEGADVWRG